MVFLLSAGESHELFNNAKSGEVPALFLSAPAPAGPARLEAYLQEYKGRHDIDAGAAGAGAAAVADEEDSTSRRV